MGTVMPFRRPAPAGQCRRAPTAEDLVVAQVRLWCAWARVINRIWWGA